MIIRHNNTLFFICFLICFMLLGLTRMSLASCVQPTVRFFCDWASLQSALMTVPHVHNSDETFINNSWVNDCLGIPDGTRGAYGCSGTNEGDGATYIFLFLGTDAAAGCESDGGCGDLASRLEAECGGPGTYEINLNDCTGHCFPNGQCAQAYEAACTRCGSVLIDGVFKCRIAFFDNVTCTAVCSDCNDEYLEKKQECENPWFVGIDLLGCNYTCSCTDLIPQAEQACPFGFSMQPDCSYTCLSCSQLEATCKANCPNGGQFLCEDVNNIPKDHLCICKESNCDAFYDSCHAACDTPECGGVKVAKCLSNGDEVTYTRCECNGCSKPPENPDGGDGGEDPSDDPADGSDLVGWLKAIKENTDTLVVQGDDHTGWLSSIKKNGDTANQILEKIAGKNTSVTVNVPAPIVNVDAPVVNVDTQGVVNAIGQTNQKLDGIGGTLSDVKGGVDGVNGKLDDANGNLEGIGETLTDIKDILSGEGGEVEVIAGTYSEMPETGYGDVPTDDDLPTAEETNSAFGTLTTREDGYRGQLASKLSTMGISVSSTSCQSEISIPWFVRSGWISWSYSPRTFILDFCPYQSYFEMLGLVLVFVVSLYELYRFS